MGLRDVLSAQASGVPVNVLSVPELVVPADTSPWFTVGGPADALFNLPDHQSIVFVDAQSDPQLNYSSLALQ